MVKSHPKDWVLHTICSNEKFYLHLQQYIDVSQSSEASNQKYSKSDEKNSDKNSSKNTEVIRDVRGTRSAVYARGLRKSKCVEKRYHETDVIGKEEEEVLNSSYQSTSTTSQPSSTQQSTTQ
ncbi:16511_t:CDS:2 [Funneliformis geosporum]|uniref:16511_t:CDS:1 n=1 Tax=Funneliformis geosporum TaxID=1117311 RepID=A0A9W4SUF0_9GLOM|nr:16511_t:CDS:2 [Funneliformis geosporum]